MSDLLFFLSLLCLSLSVSFDFSLHTFPQHLELSCESEEGFLMYNTTTVVNGVTATFGIPTFCEHGTPFVFCNDGTFDISGVIPICQTLGYECKYSLSNCTLRR